MKLSLVASWDQIIRYPSIWLALLFSSLTGFVLANPTFLFSVVSFFPQELQLPAAIIIGLLTLALVVATRVFKLDKGGDGGTSDEAAANGTAETN